MARRLLLLAFTLSGVATLVYEIVWVKWLVYLFGVTYHAITTVVTVFMLGLAIGALVAGRLADRVKDPLKLYLGIEVGIATFGLAFPTIFGAVSSIYLRAHDGLELSFFGHILVRFALACLMLVLPTVIMGATLPAMARYFVGDRRRLGVDMGRLYAFNTLGAALGCGLTGFWLIHSLGLAATNGLAVGLNLGAAAIAGGLILRGGSQGGRSPGLGEGSGGEPPGATAEVSRPLTPSASEDAPPLAEAARLSRSSERAEQGPVAGAAPPAVSPAGASGEPMSDEAASEGTGSVWLLLAFFLAGFTVVAYELLWTRVIVLIHPNAHAPAFTLVLELILVGTALGSAAYTGRWLRRIRPLSLYAGLQALSGIVALAVPFLFVTIRDQLGAAWYAPARLLGGLIDLHLTQAEVALIFAAVGVPALCSGMAFPLGSRLYVRRIQVLGADIGAVYFFSTLGGIAGSFATGFFLMPAVGVKGALFVMAALNVALGVILGLASLYRGGGRPWARVAALPAALAAGGLVLLLGGLLPVWMFINIPAKFNVMFYRDGRSTTDAGLEIVGPGTKRSHELYSTGELIGPGFFAVWAPVALSAAPERVLIQSFDAGGMSAMAVSLPRVKSVESVDISDGQLLVASYFRDINRDVMNDPRFHMVCNDARNHLLTRRGGFDVIFHGVAYYASYLELSTREYFTLARRSLREGGIYAHKLHPLVLGVEGYRRVISSFLEVFPDAWLWESEMDGIEVLIGWRDGQGPMDYPALAASWDKRLSGGIHPGWDLPDFAAKLKLDGDGLRALSAGAEVLRDDKPPRVTEMLAHLWDPEHDEQGDDGKGGGAKDSSGPRPHSGARAIQALQERYRSPLGAFFSDVPEDIAAEIEARRAQQRWAPQGSLGVEPIGE